MVPLSEIAADCIPISLTTTYAAEILTSRHVQYVCHTDYIDYSKMLFWECFVELTFFFLSGDW